MKKGRATFPVVFVIALLLFGCNDKSNGDKGLTGGTRDRNNSAGKGGGASSTKGTGGDDTVKIDGAFLEGGAEKGVGASGGNERNGDAASGAGGVGGANDGGVSSSGAGRSTLTGGNGGNGPVETGGKGGTAVGFTGDCSNVPCWTTPLCTAGCIFPCGCCPCTEGTTMNAYKCEGGCWADNKSAPLASGCYYDGAWGPQLFKRGEQFVARNFCSTCKCTDDNVVVCFELACCDTANRKTPRRFYAGDQETCSTFDLLECKGINATKFSDDCGCGCQQDPDCPESFDCKPNANQPCNFSDIFNRCPYSDIFL